MEAKAAAVERKLSRILLPGYDIDIVSSGLVTRFRISRDGKKVAVFLDYSSRNPRCGFRKVIAGALIDSVVAQIKEALKEDFEEVLVLDEFTGARIGC
ncbi:MAG: hypothetical protein NZ902_00400 [Acidilobaceae archaeon]|nr:hypothetical protein [Acidilobaceae archaeon]MCX8165297.1 hypothetical protein [Acidilobaceae archaeon]MDW7973723.1 hypothetical protein [Sulfolobales archaeon]